MHLVWSMKAATHSGKSHSNMYLLKKHSIQDTVTCSSHGQFVWKRKFYCSVLMIFTESSYFTWDDSVLKFDLKLAQWLFSQHVSALSFTWPALGCSRYLRARYVHQSPNTWHHDVISWPLIIRSPATKSCYWTIYQGRCWCLQLIIS